MVYERGVLEMGLEYIWTRLKQQYLAARLQHGSQLICH